jgi:hypothetical protein
MLILVWSLNSVFDQLSGLHLQYALPFLGLAKKQLQWNLKLLQWFQLLHHRQFGIIISCVYVCMCVCICMDVCFPCTYLLKYQYLYHNFIFYNGCERSEGEYVIFTPDIKLLPQI